MQQFENLIDPAQFANVARYLTDQSAIHYLLHVRNRQSLVGLAQELDKEISQGSIGGANALRILSRQMREGNLLITGRTRLAHNISEYEVTLSSVPGPALCEVIYLPPFYLVHTPGLFEGTLLRHDVPSAEQAVRERYPRMRMKA